MRDSIDYSTQPTTHSPAETTLKEAKRVSDSARKKEIRALLAAAGVA